MKHSPLTAARLLPLLVLALILSACTSVQVQSLDGSLGLRHVCIQENSKVIVDDFLGVVRDGFDRHGINTKVCPSSAPVHCDYVLTYTARQSWDFEAYLSHAELRLEHKGQKIAGANYHLTAGGGLSLMKWQSVQSKMDPVIDDLLAQYPSRDAVSP